VSSPAVFGAEHRPPKGCPVSSALRVASPDTIILLTVDSCSRWGSGPPCVCPWWVTWLIVIIHSMSHTHLPWNDVTYLWRCQTVYVCPHRQTDWLTDWLSDWWCSTVAGRTVYISVFTRWNSWVVSHTSGLHCTVVLSNTMSVCLSVCLSVCMCVSGCVVFAWVAYRVVVYMLHVSNALFVWHWSIVSTEWDRLVHVSVDICLSWAVCVCVCVSYPRHTQTGTAAEHLSTDVIAMSRHGPAQLIQSAVNYQLQCVCQ